MSNIYDRRENESLMDYEERLYRNQSLYGLSWEEINNLLGINQHYDSTRKASYGYIKRIDQEKEHQFDKSVMIINDLHLPFERNDILEIVNKHKNEIDTLVIGGDLIDCQSISFFPKIKTLTLEYELVYAYNFLKRVRKILDNNQKIIIINGNHEERWYRDICNLHENLHEKDMQKFINHMIIEGFTIYEGNKKHKYKGIQNIIYIPHWFVNIDNKIIVAHPKDFSRVDGKMCEKTSEHFLNRDEEFEVICFGHTHKYSQMTVSRRQGVYIIENGCMCQPMQYSDVGKLNYTPQSYCYTIIRYNNNEKINYNNIKVYHLDELYDKNHMINYNVKL